MSRVALSVAGAVLFMWCLTVNAANAQSTASEPDSCGPYVLNGAVLECAASGTVRQQLRTSTFIAGSVATGETLAQAMGLEVATAPTGSSSGGFVFTFDLRSRQFNQTSSTFGPGFAERALTIGQGKISAGINFIRRRYDAFDDLDLDQFAVFRFQGGTLPVSSSRMELETHTQTVAGFAHYGVSDSVDLGVSIPYAKVSVRGTSRIYGQPDEELQRVLIDASHAGLGDIALFGKYRFAHFGPRAEVGAAPNSDLAVAVTVHLPTGDQDNLLGLPATRTSFAFIGSGAWGRIAPHVNVGYEFWSSGVDTPRDFQGDVPSISIKDQLQYAVGAEVELHPRLTAVGEILGRYRRGGGRIGYQPFAFPPNRSNVEGAEALVAIPEGFNTVTLVPGLKWNFYRAALLTGHVLIAATDGGLRDRVTPVIGVDWGF